MSLLLLEFNCEKTKAGEDVLSGLFSFDLNQAWLKPVPRQTARRATQLQARSGNVAQPQMLQG